METLAQQLHAVLSGALGRPADGPDATTTPADSAPAEPTTDPFDDAPLAAPDRDAYVRQATAKAGYTGPNPDAFAARVQGDTRAEIDADVQALVDLYGAPPARVMATDASQGKGDGYVADSESARFVRFLNDNLTRTNFNV